MSEPLASSRDRPHSSAAKNRFHKPQDRHGRTGCTTRSISSYTCIPNMQKDNGVKILPRASCICELCSHVDAWIVRSSTLCSLSGNIEPNASLRLAVVGPTFNRIRASKQLVISYLEQVPAMATGQLLLNSEPMAVHTCPSFPLLTAEVVMSACRPCVLAYWRKTFKFCGGAPYFEACELFSGETRIETNT